MPGVAIMDKTAGNNKKSGMPKRCPITLIQLSFVYRMASGGFVRLVRKRENMADLLDDIITQSHFGGKMKVMKMEPFNDPSKHYRTLNGHYLSTYGKKVYKIPLNGGFSCPNIDGTVAYGGCTFCSALGSGDFAGDRHDPLTVQFRQGLEMMRAKWKDGLLIPYFQANTNTHGPVGKLKALFEEAITLDPRIVMLSIATRPDSLPKDVMDYLEDLARRIPLQVELGLQSINETTARLVNRAHSLGVFDDAVRRLRAIGADVVVHIINGLPHETEDMMTDTARHLNTLDIQGVKIHMLHIMKNSRMGVAYLKDPWPVLSLEDYVRITVKQLRLLNPAFVIHRLTGDAPADLLIAPEWTRKKFVVMNEIDKLMRKENTWQGDLYDEHDHQDKPSSPL
jgi:uncharacterized protein